MPRSFDDFRATVRRLITNDIVDDLKSSHNRFAAASGPMAEEISCSTSRLKDEDLQAIASHLEDLPGESPTASALPADDPTMRAGGAIYRDRQVEMGAQPCAAPGRVGWRFLALRRDVS
ncbi:MAG: hypothetical protein JO124_01440 [Hyphomicrobiales bacterium]|nr:hypothetical protein [Hyphomicrobiales bacterium]